MTKNLDSIGLQSIADNYDLFYIDLWGVIHNGIKLHEGAIFTLKKLLEINKNFILLTNAPRPIQPVKEFLEKMGLEKKFRDKVFTSGEAALNFIKKFYSLKRFYHIGPPRDFDLFNDFRNNKSKEIDQCQYFLCTGLFDDYDQDLNYYKDLLEKHIDKKMICTNPDLIVDRGNRRELCAEVYNQSIDNKNKKILSIGDNLNTDIKGANLLNYDSLLISNGVHKNEIKDKGIEKISKQYESIVNFMQSDLTW